MDGVSIPWRGRWKSIMEVDEETDLRTPFFWKGLNWHNHTRIFQEFVFSTVGGNYFGRKKMAICFQQEGEEHARLRVYPISWRYLAI